MSGIMYKNRPYAGGGAGGGGIPMWRVKYYEDNIFINREYVRDGDDALFKYKRNTWSNTSGGAINPDAQLLISNDLSLYYVSSVGMPEVMYKFSENREHVPYIYTYTVQVSGNYFVYTEASTYGSDASYATISSTGTQKYEEHFNVYSTQLRCAVYECEAGDTITVSLNKTSTFYDEYHIFNIAILNMHASFDSVTKETAQIVGENATATASASTTGVKFAFAASNYQTTVQHTATYTDTTGAEVLEFSETGSMGMSCVAIESEYVAGDTLSVSASTSSAPGYNNSFALILNLISA